MTPADIAVVELSSFQLMTMEQSADIAVVTNVAPNHLDVHKDMAEYVQAKKNVFEYQNETGKVVLNDENDITRGFAADAKGTVEFFSRLARPENGVYLEDGVICRNGKRSWPPPTSAFRASTTSKTIWPPLVPSKDLRRTRILTRSRAHSRVWSTALSSFASWTA